MGCILTGPQDDRDEIPEIKKGNCGERMVNTQVHCNIQMGGYFCLHYFSLIIGHSWRSTGIRNRKGRNNYFETPARCYHSYVLYSIDKTTSCP